MITNEVRSYEVSLWTLQDEFITVLKWSDVEQPGRIQDPEMTLGVDGTLNFKFSIPMYLEQYVDGRRIVIENPIWYNTKNGNLIEGMRKVKVIFNKLNADKAIYEFLIIKVTEEHKNDLLFCHVECESFAFHELGKIGYKINLSEESFLVDYEEWATSSPHQWTRPDGTKSSLEPQETLDYWCEHSWLIPYPTTPGAIIDPKTWYYRVDMNWGSHSDIPRSSGKIYEDEYVTSWDSSLHPVEVHAAREKMRPIEVSESNIYNITQTIAETFNVFCKYEYGYDINNHIISRTVVFYNNFLSEEDGIISFTYPYNSEEITRELDSTELTTKLFVRSEDDSTLLGGTINIMDSSANKLKEDYLLNFEYMHKCGAITDEQYESLNEYELTIHTMNETLTEDALLLNGYANQKIDLEALILVLEKSIELAQEQIDNYSALYNRIDSSDGDADGYFERKADTNYSTLALEDKENNTYYIKFNDLDKGIKKDTIAIYKTYNAAADPKLTNLITISSDSNYKTDSYGDIISVVLGSNNVSTGVFSSNESHKVYVIYKYSPKMYYDSIIQSWIQKRDADLETLDDLKDDLETLETNLASVLEEYDSTRISKDTYIHEFLKMMGPALREGYWQAENYNDYGERKSSNVAFTVSSYSEDLMRSDAGEGILVGWDAKLFDGEDKLYYEEGVLLTKQFYPCIDLSGTGVSDITLTKIKAKMNSTDGRLSFVFNNNYHKDLTNEEKALLQNVSNFTLGGKMELGFIHTGGDSDVIKPVLILTGTKSMTDDEIKFMLTSGNPKLCVFDTLNSNDLITVVSDSSAITVPLGKIYWDSDKLSGVVDIKNAERVYPRIKFSDARLKLTEDYLSIAYGLESNLLTRYEDYTALSRVSIRPDGKAGLDYFITIKPEVFVNAQSYNGTAYVKYTFSNAATCIYLDAQEVLKENSEPKVAYTIEVSALNEEYLRKLYSMLTQIVMINDVELKFENVFGYISELNLKLDKPWEDTIEVKNYKNKFEDLFSTIVAQTELMKKNENALGMALNGYIPMSEEAVEETIAEITQSKPNINILLQYLDSYFDNSDVVREKLASLFTETADLIVGAQTSLNNILELSGQNATILAEFARKVNSELTPYVFNTANLPTIFKVGDIWNQISAETGHEGEVIGRYVATSNSEDSNGGGWTRTYDGSLASITGANLNVDAVAGTIEILAQNKINIKSGGYLYLAGQNVDIVGNNAVNIGGATINIASITKNGTSYSPGGINLITNTTSTGSRILMSPTKMTFGGSSIEMYTGSSGSTSAIKIDGTSGIWMGSSNSINLYSGSGASTGSNVSINPTHIIMGVTSGNDATAFEITKDYLIMAAGTTSANFSSSDVTVNATGSITGMKLTKDSFGLAVVNNNVRTVMLMNETYGFIVGSGNTPITSGSYVQIKTTGIEIGSAANLYVNANNFKLLTNAGASANSLGTTIFAIGTNLNSITSSTNVNSLNSSSTVTFLVNSSGAFINGYVYASGGSFTGAITATSFNLSGSTAISEFNTAVSNNSDVLAASSASLAVAALAPISAYGLIGQNTDNAGSTVDGITYDSSGWPTYNSVSYGLILGNSTSKPILIGSNNGIHVINTAGTNVIKIDSTGIEVMSGGKLIIDTPTFKLNSSATGTSPMLYVADNATWNSATTGIQYTASGGLEVKGKITATSLFVGDTSSTNYLSYDSADGELNVGLTSLTIESKDSNNITLSSVHIGNGELNMHGQIGSISFSPHKWYVYATENDMPSDLEITNGNLYAVGDLFEIKSTSTLKGLVDKGDTETAPTFEDVLVVDANGNDVTLYLEGTTTLTSDALRIIQKYIGNSAVQIRLDGSITCSSLICFGDIICYGTIYAVNTDTLDTGSSGGSGGTSLGNVLSSTVTIDVY